MTDIPGTLVDGTPVQAANVRLLCIDGTDDAPTGDVIGRVGGPALLPVGMDMPVHTPGRRDEGEGDETLSHLATFSTAVLSEVAPGLPAGEIVLLYAASDQPWTYICHDMDGNVSSTSGRDGMVGGHRVVFVAKGVQTAAVDGGTVFPQRRLVAIDHLEATFDRPILEVGDDAIDQIDELNEALCGGALGEHDSAIRVHGPVVAIQNEMEPELPELGRFAHGMDTAEDDWICIAQVESLDCHMAGASVPGSWMWGDCGVLYYWMTRADLAALRFDRTLCILQCG